MRRRTDEDMRKRALAPIDGPRCYLHHDDASWSLVGGDGRPVSPEAYYAELDADVAAALGAAESTAVDAELLTAVLRGLTAIGGEPISVRDSEV
ncbi:hypothetical protein [Nocardia beijingensis]|uniref:hypothetical protein n=1 Tax=Nocardia beijingensis TaxID=95162 RepID=UPI000AABCAAB|nr:hypothetical protein [Nocardia beijingensis]